MLTLNSSDPTIAQAAAFILSAQHSLPQHDGLLPNGLGLQRLADKSARDANRAAACKSFVKRDSTDSCDEYPFASTTNQPELVGHVPVAQNSKVGSLLAAFYVSNRVLDQEQFYVDVVNG